MDKNFDLKTALKAGMTPEEMTAEFHKQLAAAQREVMDERKTATKLDKAREKMIDAAFDYAIAMEFIKEEDKADFKPVVLEAIKDAEEELKAARPLLRMLQKMTDSEEKSSKIADIDADTIIAAFKNTLR